MPLTFEQFSKLTDKAKYELYIEALKSDIILAELKSGFKDVNNNIKEMSSRNAALETLFSKEKDAKRKYRKETLPVKPLDSSTRILGVGSSILKYLPINQFPSDVQINSYPGMCTGQILGAIQ